MGTCALTVRARQRAADAGHFMTGETIVVDGGQVVAVRG
jgi:hypothetical protein